MNAKLLCFRVINHTLQLCSVSCELGLDVINSKGYIVRPTKHTARGFIFVLNANKFVGRDIDSLSVLLGVINDIKEELKITSWNLDRLDIAIDTIASFDELYKTNLMFAQLFCLYTNNNNDVVINSLSNNKKRAIVINHRKLELYIYDKLFESNGKHPYSRCEFRFKLLDITDISDVVKRLEAILTALPRYIEALNKAKIDFLVSEWQIEADTTNSGIKSFSEFVRRYDNHIFNREILQGLYIRVMKGDFKRWLYKFKKNNDLEFIGNKDMLTYCKAMKQAVKEFAK